MFWVSAAERIRYPSNHPNNTAYPQFYTETLCDSRYSRELETETKATLECRNQIDTKTEIFIFVTPGEML